MSGAEAPFSKFSSAKTHLLLRFYPALSLFCSKTDNLQLQVLDPVSLISPVSCITSVHQVICMPKF
jgi:hypothetical protein